MNQLEQFALPMLLNLLSGKAETLLAAFYTTGAKFTPAFQGETPTAYIDGQLEHWTRLHLKVWGLDFGWLVDLLWTNPNLRSVIDPIEAQVIASEAVHTSAPTAETIPA